MKLIDVLVKLSRDEIENGTILTINDGGRYRQYKYIDGFCFLDDHNSSLPLNIYGKNDLNSEVELVLPKEKRYLVKFNMRSLRNDREYLNYDERCGYVGINNKLETSSIKARFTKKELQDIQQVHEFLEDMKGKYELIEVEE